MRKTLIICDSACDITIEQEKKIENLKILNCGVEIDGLPYEERAEITAKDIYAEVEKSGRVPKTSQVTMIQFLEAFVKAARDGYTDVICVTMNSQGSGTFSSANHAKEVLPSEYPQLEGKLNIRIVDSTTYCHVIAMPVLKALEQLKKGDDPDQIADELQDWYSNSITLVGLYNLQYAKKSGRLNACAAIVGDMLGLKPVLGIAGENKMIAKTRGDKNLIPKMAQLYADMAEDVKGDYIIAYGDNPEQGKELAAAIKKISGKAPYIIAPIGSVVAVNAGPKMLGVGFKRKKAE